MIAPYSLLLNQPCCFRVSRPFSISPHTQFLARILLWSPRRFSSAAKTLFVLFALSTFCHKRHRSLNLGVRIDLILDLSAPFSFVEMFSSPILDGGTTTQRVLPFLVSEIA